MKIEYYCTKAKDVGGLSRSRRRTLYYIDWQYPSLKYRESRRKFLNAIRYRVDRMKDSLNACL